MNQAFTTVRTAADLHRYLTKNKNFDFNPDHGRDEALYTELKRTLELPDGKFLEGLSEKNISAEQYLRALMAIAEPLSEMYRGILAYCTRANVLRSKRSANIEWEITLGEERIGFSFEDFRLFDEIKTSIAPSFELMFSTKNDLMDWLAHEVFKPSHQGLPSWDFDWRSVEIFRILTNARNRLGLEYAPIFGGLNNLYLGGSGINVPADLALRVTGHRDYQAKLSAVAKAFDPEAIESIASKFIELPFWKFRWQIYEIWIITVSLSEFDHFGFQLVANHDGHSLIELGRQATLAAHDKSPSTFIYQPTYWNRNNDEVRPDIVVSSRSDATPNNVNLVIECKQRLSLDISHLEEVRIKYEAGVCPARGEVVIVNYDDVQPWPRSGQDKTTLIANVRPHSSGETEFRRFLRTTHIARSLRKEVWFVDISLSMGGVLNDEFRRCLAEHMDSLSPGQFKLYGFAQDIVERQALDLRGEVAMSQSPNDANWEGRGIDLLCIKARECLADKRVRLFIVSDIASTIENKLFLEKDEQDRVCFTDPSQVLSMLTELSF
ncbi:hypothetical protein [Pseudomonas sp. LT1P18]|uniref:hypothetical protein n=1 Tax=Pseudomonas arabinosi TaxID=3398357 RepID=UPI0039EF523D